MHVNDPAFIRPNLLSHRLGCAWDEPGLGLSPKTNPKAHPGADEEVHVGSSNVVRGCKAQQREYSARRALDSSGGPLHTSIN